MKRVFLLLSMTFLLTAGAATAVAVKKSRTVSQNEEFVVEVRKELASNGAIIP